MLLYFLNQELSKQEGKPITLGFLNDNHMVEQWVMSIAGKTEDPVKAEGLVCASQSFSQSLCVGRSAIMFQSLPQCREQCLESGRGRTKSLFPS